MFSLRPGPKVKIVTPPKIEPVAEFCARVKPAIRADEGGKLDGLGNIAQNDFLLSGASIRIAPETAQPVATPKTAAPEHYDGIQQAFKDFERNGFFIQVNKKMYGKTEFTNWLQRSDITSSETNFEQFLLQEVGISQSQLDLLRVNYGQNISAPLISGIKVLYAPGQRTGDFLPTNVHSEAVFNFDNSDRITFESRSSLTFKANVGITECEQLLPGMILTQGSFTSAGPKLEAIGCSNPVLENLVAAKNMPETFAQFQQQAALYQPQETAAQQQYQLLYTAFEPLLTKINPAYTAETEATVTSKPRIVSVVDLGKVILGYDNAELFNLRSFTDNLVNQISAKISGADREKNKNRLEYYFGLRKKPRGFRNSEEIKHFEKIIEAAKQLNQAYDNWCLEPLDMQRLREVKLKLILLQKEIEAIASNTNLPSTNKLKQHVQNSLIKENSPFNQVFDQLDSLVENIYKTPQTLLNIKQRNQTHLLPEISPFAAAMHDENFVAGVLRRDLEARRKPKELGLQNFLLQTGQPDKILKKYQTRLSIQDYFTQNECFLLKGNHKEGFYQPKIDGQPVRVILKSIHENNALEKKDENLQKIFFSPVLFLPEQKQTDATESLNLKVKFTFEDQTNVSPEKLNEIKIRNLQFALSNYPLNILQAAYSANKEESLKYARESSLYLWLKQASEEEIAYAWHNNPAIPKFLALDKEITTELMKENVHLAVFFMENAKERKQANLGNVDFQDCYNNHKSNQNFIDLLITNKLYEGWTDPAEAIVKQTHSSGKWIFRKPKMHAETNSTNCYSYLIQQDKKINFTEGAIKADAIVEHSDAAALTKLFKLLIKGKAGELQVEKENFKAVVLSSLNPETLPADARAALNLAALIRDDSELALVVYEWLEKEYYAASDQNKTSLVASLVKLACTNRSGKVAEKLLDIPLIRLFSNHPGLKLTGAQLVDIANAHDDNSKILKQIAKKRFGFSLANIINEDETKSIHSEETAKSLTKTYDEAGNKEIADFILGKQWNDIEKAKIVFKSSYWIDVVLFTESLPTEKLVELLENNELRTLIQLNYPISKEQAKELELIWAEREGTFNAVPNTAFAYIAKSANIRRELTPIPVPVVPAAVAAQDLSDSEAISILSSSLDSSSDKFISAGSSRAPSDDEEEASTSELSSSSEGEGSPKKSKIKSILKNWDKVAAGEIQEPVATIAGNQQFIEIAETSDLMACWSNEANRSILFTLPPENAANSLFPIFEKIKAQENFSWYLSKLTVEQVQRLFTNTKDPENYKQLSKTSFKRYFKQFDYEKFLEIQKEIKFPYHQDSQLRQTSLGTIKRDFELAFEKLRKNLIDHAFEIQKVFKSQTGSFVDSKTISFIAANIEPDELLDNLLNIAEENKEAFNAIWKIDVAKNSLLRINDKSQVARLTLAIETYGDENSKIFLPEEKRLINLLATLQPSDWLTALLNSCEDKNLFNATWQNKSVRAKILQIVHPDSLIKLVLAIDAHGDNVSKAILKACDIQKLEQAFQTTDFILFRTLCASELVREFLTPGSHAAGVIRNLTPAIIANDQRARQIWDEFKIKISTEEERAQGVTEQTCVIEALVQNIVQPNLQLARRLTTVE